MANNTKSGNTKSGLPASGKSLPTKQHWQQVALRPLDGGGYGLWLDTQLLATPKGQPLKLHSKTLAEAMLAEWQALQGQLKPAQLPLSQLVFTVLDLVPQRKADMLAEITAHADNELLCFWSAEQPLLVQMQQQEWQPWLNWAKQQGFDFNVAQTLSDKTLASHAPLRQYLAALDDTTLLILQQAVVLTGSFILGLAFQQAVLTADKAHALAELEMRFQQQKWGIDEEAAASSAAKLAEMQVLEQFSKMR